MSANTEIIDPLLQRMQLHHAQSVQVERLINQICLVQELSSDWY